jgi:hypothetical protein
VAAPTCLNATFLCMVAYMYVTDGGPGLPIPITLFTSRYFGICCIFRFSDAFPYYRVLSTTTLICIVMIRSLTKKVSRLKLFKGDESKQSPPEPIVKTSTYPNQSGGSLSTYAQQTTQNGFSLSLITVSETLSDSPGPRAVTRGSRRLSRQPAGQPSSQQPSSQRSAGRFPGQQLLNRTPKNRTPAPIPEYDEYHGISYTPAAHGGGSADTGTWQTYDEDEWWLAGDETSARAPQGGEKDCTVCAETKSPSQFPRHGVTDGCNHTPGACLDCIRTQIKTNMSDKMWTPTSVTCPECSQPLSHDGIRRYADRKTFEK